MRWSTARVEIGLRDRPCYSGDEQQERSALFLVCRTVISLPVCLGMEKLAVDSRISSRLETTIVS